MSRKYKIFEGGLFFVTLSVVGWIDVFTRSEYADELIRNLNYCIRHKGVKVYAFCIMPSHLHLVSSTEEGSLSDVCLRDFKSYTAKKIIELIKKNPEESRKDWLLYLFAYYAKKQSHNGQYQFWQQHNQPISLETNEWITEKINYIHQNPVKARLTDEATHYVYSSAYPLTELMLELFGLIRLIARASGPVLTINRLPAGVFSRARGLTVRSTSPEARAISGDEIVR